MKHLALSLSALALCLASTGVRANEEDHPAEPPPIVKEMAARLARCGVASLAQFPEEAELPAPAEWTGSMEIPMNDVRGVDTFNHTLIVHQGLNSGWVISTGGTEGSKVRGPIPLDWQCKKKGQAKAGKAPKEAKASKQGAKAAP